MPDDAAQTGVDARRQPHEALIALLICEGHCDIPAVERARQLAKCCAQHGFDLLIAADEAAIGEAAAQLRGLGVAVDAVESDLATLDGVDRLHAATLARPVEVLLANAGRGLGRAFLDQDFGEVRRVVDTNITGTVHLVQKVGRDMRARQRPNPDHRLDRRIHAGHVSGGL